MPAGDICIRDVVVCARNTSIQEAAELMRQHHVGDLVLVDERDGKRIPVGIVTDRDIVVSVLAAGLDPATFTAGDLVVRDLVTVREEYSTVETIHKMRMHGVRRIPVVDKDASLVGIISVDDLIALFAEEMGELAKLISREQAQEAETRR